MEKWRAWVFARGRFPSIHKRVFSQRKVINGNERVIKVN